MWAGESDRDQVMQTLKIKINEKGLNNFLNVMENRDKHRQGVISKEDFKSALEAELNLKIPDFVADKLLVTVGALPPSMQGSVVYREFIERIRYDASPPSFSPPASPVRRSPTPLADMTRVGKRLPESSYFLLSGKLSDLAACLFEAVRLAMGEIPRHLTADTVSCKQLPTVTSRLTPSSSVK